LEEEFLSIVLCSFPQWIHPEERDNVTIPVVDVVVDLPQVLQTDSKRVAGKRLGHHHERAERKGFHTNGSQIARGSTACRKTGRSWID
jgi:hypothetical protein